MDAGGFEDSPRHIYNAEYDFPACETQSIDYLICCGPRSGSTLLVYLLTACGMMGLPGEYLNPRHIMPGMARRLGVADKNDRVNIREYLAALRKHRTSPNGVFGMKVMYDQMEPLLGGPPMPGFIDRAQLIHIRRRDVVAQAISLHIATVTGIWHVTNGSGGKHPPPPDYDGPKIREHAENILAQDAGYERLFASRRAHAFPVWYEDLVADTDRVCHAVCDHVGVTPRWTFELSKAGIYKTASARNEDWKRRFHAEYGDIGALRSDAAR